MAGLMFHFPPAQERKAQVRMYNKRSASVVLESNVQLMHGCWRECFNFLPPRSGSPTPAGGYSASLKMYHVSISCLPGAEVPREVLLHSRGDMCPMFQFPASQERKSHVCVS